MKQRLLGLLIIISLVAISCNKKNLGYITRNGAPTTADIVVKNISGKAVANKQVIVYGEGSKDDLRESDIKFSKKTNGSGTASFDFSEIYRRGSVGVATLIVAVMRAPNDTLVFRNANDKRLELVPEDHVVHNVVVNP